MKLHQLLYKQGVFSRRVSDDMIRSGYVLVNQVLIQDPLYMVSSTDVVSLHSNIHDYASKLGVILFNKPRGIFTNCKLNQNQKEIIDLLPKKYQSFASIGRLDKASEGLILLTNDGVFANQFLNHQETHERSYLVWTKSNLTQMQLSMLSKGVQLTDGYTKPCVVRQLKPRLYEFILTEGKNRQIRRMVEVCDTHVTRLKRISFSSYKLGDLLPGQFYFQSLSSVFLDRASAFL